MTLFEEYNQQLEIINKELEIKNKLNNTLQKKDLNLIKEITSLNSGKGNLELAIFWMEHGYQRGKRQGIENIKVYRDGVIKEKGY
jgi:hypothetical protein